MQLHNFFWKFFKKSRVKSWSSWKENPLLRLPIFLGIKFDQNLCFNSHIEFIRSRCQDRINIIKILSHKSWKLSKKTLVGVYNALVGSIIDYIFFISSLASHTNFHKLQVQNVSFKSIYHLPYDTPTEIFLKFLEDIKLDTIKERLKKLFIKYIKNCFSHKNNLILTLSKDYVDVFVESPRDPEFKTPLSLVSSNLHQWTMQIL